MIKVHVKAIIESPGQSFFNSVYLRQTRLITGQKLHVEPQFKSVSVFLYKLYWVSRPNWAWSVKQGHIPYYNLEQSSSLDTNVVKNSGPWSLLSSVIILTSPAVAVFFAWLGAALLWVTFPVEPLSETDVPLSHRRWVGWGSGGMPTIGLSLNTSELLPIFWWAGYQPNSPLRWVPTSGGAGRTNRPFRGPRGRHLPWWYFPLWSAPEISHAPSDLHQCGRAGGGVTRGYQLNSSLFI